MKYIAPMAALALAATQVSAGNLVTPKVEPAIEVSEEQTAAGSDWILPLLAVGMIAIIATSGSSSTTTPC